MTGNNFLSQEELVNGCARGDRRCQEALYRLYSGKMYAVCIGYSNSRERAKDVLQDGFIKVFRSIRNFSRQGSLEGWIRKIMVNTSIDHFRKKKKEGIIFDENMIESISSDAQALDHLLAKELLVLIGQLPEGARLIFNLFAVEGYSHREIAEILDIREGTSKSQLARAKTLLQDLLQKYNEPKISVPKGVRLEK